MGPRAIARGDEEAAPTAPDTRHGSLQWGRGRSPAEIRPSPGRPSPRTAPLQWGRGRSPAEINRTRVSVLRESTLLQWGRGRSPAEIAAASGVPLIALGASMGPRAIARGDPSSPGGDSADYARFNGAAGDRPRRYVLAVVSRTRLRASMGPRAIARGDLRKRAPCTGDRGASMGPRAIARGDPDRSEYAIRSLQCFNGAAGDRPRRFDRAAAQRMQQEALQWGRGRSPAEINCASSSSVVPAGLQWGRGRSPAEMGASHHDVVPSIRLASMGPRAIARGDVVTTKGKQKGKKLQWGRGRSPAEIAGKCGSAWRQRKLQWGRGRSPAEMLRLGTSPCTAPGFNGAAGDRPRR